jgi:large subunit ribosomal protein L18
MNKNIKAAKRIRRHKAIRARVSGTAEKPRLAVFKSNKFMYAQLIDDSAAKTIAAASSKEVKGTKKVDGAKLVGKSIAEKAKAIKVETVVFDRGGFAYKGRVKALADAAREAGLKF